MRRWADPVQAAGTSGGRCRAREVRSVLSRTGKRVRTIYAHKLFGPVWFPCVPISRGYTLGACAATFSLSCVLPLSGSLNRRSTRITWPATGEADVPRRR